MSETFGEQKINPAEEQRFIDAVSDFGPFFTTEVEGEVNAAGELVGEGFTYETCEREVGEDVVEISVLTGRNADRQVMNVVSAVEIQTPIGEHTQVRRYSVHAIAASTRPLIRYALFEEVLIDAEGEVVPQITYADAIKDEVKARNLPGKEEILEIMHRIYLAEEEIETLAPNWAFSANTFTTARLLEVLRILEELKY